MAARILVVEDETLVRDMICFALSQADFECESADDAVVALEKISADDRSRHRH